MAFQHQEVETIELYEEEVFAQEEVPHPQWTVVELNRGLARVKDPLPASVGLQVGELMYVACAHVFPIRFEKCEAGPSTSVDVRIVVGSAAELQSFRRKFWVLDTPDLVAWMVRSCLADRQGLQVVHRHRLLKILGHHFGRSVRSAAKAYAKSFFWGGPSSKADSDADSTTGSDSSSDSE